MELLRNTTDYVDWLYSISDPRVEKWLFMSSHWPTLAITAVYLGIVKLGPKLMENRCARLCPKFSRHRCVMKLEPVMIAYNLCVAALNAFICYNAYTAAVALNYSYVCQEVVYSYDTNEMRMASTIWYFYMSKIVELLDTVFLILRKKTDQLSFLHVYHHATMVLFWYIGARWVAGGSAFFPTLTNSFVHVLMYAYYGLAALGPEIRKFLWWKPYLTQIQMAQFILGLYFGIQSFYVPCKFPPWMKHAFVAYMASLLILFGNFYHKRYFPKKLQPTQYAAANGYKKKISHKDIAKKKI